MSSEETSRPSGIDKVQHVTSRVAIDAESLRTNVGELERVAGTGVAAAVLSQLSCIEPSFRPSRPVAEIPPGAVAGPLPVATDRVSVASAPVS